MNKVLYKVRFATAEFSGFELVMDAEDFATKLGEVLGDWGFDPEYAIIGYDMEVAK